MIKLKDIINEAVSEVEKTKTKLKRDIFVYLDPKEPRDQFAQCATCRMWTGKDNNTCSILGKTKVTGDMSCDLYTYGKPSLSLAGKEVATYTPEEVGLVKRSVRCQNCRSFDPQKSVCMLYQALNQKNADLFDLDEKVNPQGCCNAQMPKNDQA